MIQKPTNELNEILENTKISQLDGYIMENRQYLANAEKTFYYYMKEILDQKHIKLKELFEKKQTLILKPFCFLTLLQIKVNFYLQTKL